ncbi:hypothetical protein [Lysinibacillus sp. NPDC093692]|uniref:hypothetical protein n=1 Tax=Lysinibacillus sp. NPDC093692 TaxID=3390578 RepID=UPI003D05792D
MQLVWEKPDVYKLSQVNQDNLWKKLIADLFEDFLLFFLPELHAEVNFSKQVEFLQQELFKEIIEQRQGRKIADQIAKVHLKSGKEQWILMVRRLWLLLFLRIRVLIARTGIMKSIMVQN